MAILRSRWVVGRSIGGRVLSAVLGQLVLVLVITLLLELIDVSTDDNSNVCEVRGEGEKRRVNVRKI